MNFRKAMLGLSIILGVIIGGYLSSVSTDSSVGGAVLGALLGGVVYYLIDWAVSRRRKDVLPYDGLDGHHQVNTGGNSQITIDTFKPFNNRER
jgi:hypothetical protein